VSFVGAAFLVFLRLSVANAASRPALALSDLSADTCGGVHGTLEVRPKGRDRDVVVTVDGAPHEVRVPSNAESVRFVLPAGQWRPHAEVSASWRFVGTDSGTVLRPRWDVDLLLTPPHDPAEGEVPPLGVQLTGGCGEQRLELRVVAGGRVLHRGPVGDVSLPLAMGSHGLDATLSDGAFVVAREQLVIEVGPPCIDHDGDGFPRCHDRDCDDLDPSVHPGAEDIVGNNIDEDCDGRNGQDRDRDGFEDVAVGGDDCDDHQPLVNPAALRFPDADGDGASPFRRVDFDCDGVIDARPGPYDCDDANPVVPSEEAPVPTGVDEDCDGLVDEGTVVFDDDGDGLSEEQGDCNDADVHVRPGARETPDCRDEDCDGVVDNGVTRAAKDDRYEPNDVDAPEVPGAWWKSGLLGGRYRASSTSVPTVTRGLDDLERFTVFAHDSGFDTFHVSVQVEAVGDDRAYEISITSRHGQRVRGVVRAPGDGVSIGGKAGRDDTGTYRIEVRPVIGELDWCPLELVVSTG
jgi:hypothetical protein